MDAKYIFDRLKEIDNDIAKQENAINSSLEKMDELKNVFNSACSELVSLNYEKAELLNEANSRVFSIPKIE